MKPVLVTKLRLYHIPDGKKHKRFPIIIWKLLKLNADLNLEEVKSFMNYINENFTYNSPMDKKHMVTLVQFCFENFDPAKLPGKMRKFWINQNAGLTPREKSDIINKKSGELRRLESIKKIRLVLNNLIVKGESVDKTKVAKMCNLSRQCVSRHWENCTNDLTPDYLELPDLPDLNCSSQLKDIDKHFQINPASKNRVYSNLSLGEDKTDFVEYYVQEWGYKIYSPQYFEVVHKMNKQKAAIFYQNQFKWH